MDNDEVASLIEADIEDARAHVYTADQHGDNEHLGAIVVSPVFEDESLVDRHQRVHDALKGHLTRDFHAIEMRTYTPEEYAEAAEDLGVPIDEHP